MMDNSITVISPKGYRVTFTMKEAKILQRLVNAKGFTLYFTDLVEGKLEHSNPSLKALNNLRYSQAPKVISSGLPVRISLTPLGYEYAQLVDKALSLK
jgi:hypothetical protein